MSIRKNTVYNLCGHILPLIFALTTLPMYIKLIGEERYGVLSLVLLFFGYFGLLDLGLGRATAQKIAEMHNACIEEREEVFWTALISNFGLGLFFGILICPIAYSVIGSNIENTVTFRNEILLTIPLFVIALPLTTISSVLKGALQGREQFLSLNIVTTIGSGLFQFFPLVAAILFEPTLSYLILSLLIAKGINIVILFCFCKKYLELKNFSFKKRTALMLLEFGGWITISSIISPLLTTIDRIMIGSMLGTNMVTSYVVPSDLVQKGGIIPSSLAVAIFPKLASESSNSYKKKLTIKCLIFIGIIITPCVIFGIQIFEPFLSLWISKDFSEKAANIGHILAVGFWFNSSARIPYIELLAKGKPDVVAKCHLLEFIPYVILLWLFLKNYGIEGAAIAWSLRVFLDTILLFIFTKLISEAFHLLWPACILIIIGALTSILFPINSFLRWSINLITILTCVIWIWFTLRFTLKKISATFN
ncbi:MAG: flippase [Pseudomonadota bacterium]